MVDQSCHIAPVSRINYNIFTDLKKLQNNIILIKIKTEQKTQQSSKHTIKTHVAIFPLRPILHLPQICNTTPHLLTTVFKNLQKHMQLIQLNKYTVGFVANLSNYGKKKKYHFSFQNLPPCKKTPSMYSRFAKTNTTFFHSLNLDT